MALKTAEGWTVRMERKQIVPFSETTRVQARIKRLPLAFRTAYPERIVTSLYFDTLDKRFLHEAIDGIGEREKIRIRFYGDLYPSRAALEIKRREGTSMRKGVFGPFDVPSGEDNAIVSRLLEGVGQLDQGRLKTLRPVLMNRYQRRYYESADRRLRVTVDENIRYFRISPQSVSEAALPEQPAVIEVKYAPEYEELASRVTNALPYRLAKHSKYVRGLQLINK